MPARSLSKGEDLLISDIKKFCPVKCAYVENIHSNYSVQHGPEKPENPKNRPEKDRSGPVPKQFWSPPDDRTGPGQTSKAHGVTRRIFFG